MEKTGGVPAFCLMVILLLLAAAASSWGLAAAAQEAEPAERPPDQLARAADGGGGADAQDDADAPYTVKCASGAVAATDCEVDRATYVGWRTFHAVCHTCHAQDAVGSTFAPALLPRVKDMEKARFVEVVDEGFTGQVGVMPGWGENPNVNRFYDELWSYLRARADGALPPGRPQRLPDPD